MRAKLLIPIGFTLWVGITAYSILSVHRFTQMVTEQKHLLSIKSSLNDLLIALDRTESSYRDYLAKNEKGELHEYFRYRDSIPPILNRLKELISNKTPSVSVEDQLYQLLESRIQEMDQKINQFVHNPPVMKSDAKNQALPLSSEKVTDLQMGPILKMIRRLHEQEGREVEAHQGSIERLGSHAIPLISLGNFLAFLTLAISLNAMFNEVRKRIQVARQLDAAQRRAAEESAHKSQFLATVSHEIRTPLNGIIGLSETLLHGELPPKASFHVGLIRYSGQLLLRIVNDILDFSKVEAGQLEIAQGEVKIPELLRMGVLIHHQHAAQKGLQLQLDMAQGLPLVAHTDEERLLQILHNLIGNAIKFTENGKISVRAKPLRERESKPGFFWIQIEVEDTGIGIASSDYQQVFKPFKQIISPNGKREDGTGLGLAISRALVEKLGGQMGFNSEIQKGSRFFAEIPLEIFLESGFLAQDQVETFSNDLPVTTKNYHPQAFTHPPNFALEEKEPPKLTSSINQNPHDVRPYILVAEDNDVNAVVISEHLKSFNLRVEIAKDGLEALMKFTASTPTIVLLDCEMPQLSGYEVARELRRLGYDGPIIAVTAHIGNNLLQRCLDSGIDDLIHKPLKMEIFEARLKFWLASTNLDAVRVETLTNLASNTSPAVVNKMIHSFSQTLAEATQIMMDALKQKDLPAVQFQIHKLIGSAETLGLSQLSPFLRISETQCLADRPLPWLTADIKKIVSKQESIIDNLKLAQETSTQTFPKNEHHWHCPI